jgi:molecular chaperone IbpA
LQNPAEVPIPKASFKKISKRVLKPKRAKLDRISPDHSAQKDLVRAPAECPARCSYPCCSTEDVAMRNYDFSTFSRSSVGFEPLFNLINEAQKRFNDEGGFPPYDIVRKDDATYTIRLVAAGFSQEELTITAKQNLLTVVGQKKAEEQRQYLHEGISTRSFERQFSLADHVQVRGASYKDGILEIELHQEIPEAAKPRKIAINGGASAKLIS